MKRIVACALIVLSCIVISSPSYGIDQVDKFQYKKTKTGRYYVLVNRVTGEMKSCWRAGEVDINKPADLLNEYVEDQHKQDYWHVSNPKPGYLPLTGIGTWRVSTPDIKQRLQELYDVENAAKLDEQLK